MQSRSAPHHQDESMLPMIGTVAQRLAWTGGDAVMACVATRYGADVDNQSLGVSPMLDETLIAGFMECKKHAMGVDYARLV